MSVTCLDIYQCTLDLRDVVTDYDLLVDFLDCGRPIEFYRELVLILVGDDIPKLVYGSFFDSR